MFEEIFDICSCADPIDFYDMFYYHEKEQFPRPENWKVPVRFKRQKKKSIRRLMDSKSGWVKK